MKHIMEHIMITAKSTHALTAFRKNVILISSVDLGLTVKGMRTVVKVVAESHI